MVGVGGSRDVACAPSPPVQLTTIPCLTAAYLLCSRSMPDPSMRPAAPTGEAGRVDCLLIHGSQVTCTATELVGVSAAAHALQPRQCVLTGVLCALRRTSSVADTCSSPAPSHTSWPYAGSWRPRALSARPSRTTSPSAAGTNPFRHAVLLLCIWLMRQVLSKATVYAPQAMQVKAAPLHVCTAAPLL